MQNRMKKPNENAGEMAWWAHVVGALVLCGNLALAARLVWEQTALTWSRGPQMVGFSLLHGSWGILVVLSPVLLLGWILVLAVRAAWARIRGRPVGRATAAYLVAGAALAGLLLTPYGVWQTIFAGRISRGPYAGEFMTYAAATGDLRTVRALLAHGVPAGVTSRDGQTGLHAAAVGNQMEALALLVRAGAPLDALDRSGDSALQQADDSDSRDAARFLAAHGAHRIRGSEAQHQRAAHDIVAREMGLMDERPTLADPVIP